MLLTNSNLTDNGSEMLMNHRTRWCSSQHVELHCNVANVYMMYVCSHAAMPTGLISCDLFDSHFAADSHEVEIFLIF